MAEITHINPEIKELLDSSAHRINSKAFIAADPVQFPRRYEKLQDIEIAAFLSAIIAWGNRKMICRDADRMLGMMDNSPYAFTMEEAYEHLDPSKNVHRTFFNRHLQYFLRGMRHIYKSYGSLDDFASAMHIGDNEAPAWALAEAMQHMMMEANNGLTCSQCIPTNLSATALKRINMALRWLVRDDGIVDMGVWRSIPKSKLFIPLDVHVGNVARELGILSRRSNDRRAVEEVTAVCRTLNPDDPAIYDFALFGIGIESKN